MNQSCSVQTSTREQDTRFEDKSVATHSSCPQTDDMVHGAFRVLHC